MPVKYTEEGAVSVVTLARSERLNAISSDLMDSFLECLDKAEASSTHVILLEAEGRAFCSGDDLVELAASDPDLTYAENFVGRLQSITRKLMFNSKPVICAAQGYIVGGGAAWPMNADFSIVADDAILFCPEVGYGMYPSGGATILLEACCGAARAAEILWRAKRVDAAQMFADGIIGSCVARESLSTAARALAKEIADLPASSRARIKAQRTRLNRDRIEAAMAIETEYCIQAALDPEMRKAVTQARGQN